MPTCNQTDLNTLFAYVSELLDETKFDTLSDSVLEKAPKQYGLSYGHLYGITGSIGITSVSGVQSNLELDFDNAQAALSLVCGNSDYAYYQVPIRLASGTMNLESQIRVSGLGIVLPSSPVDLTKTIECSLTGLLLVSVPIQNGLLQFSKVLVDIQLYAQPAPIDYGADIGQKETILLSSVPVSRLVDQFMSQWNVFYKKHLPEQIRLVLQKRDAPLQCQLPTLVNQTCSFGTLVPGQMCNPCDTCCNCLIQQRCDGDCSSCACVRCETNQWSYLQILTTLLILTFLVAFVIQV